MFAWDFSSPCPTPNPARPRSGTIKYLGPRLGQRKRPEGRRACLRPQAEFARASGRGRRRVKYLIKDAKGMCKKEIQILSSGHLSCVPNWGLTFYRIASPLILLKFPDFTSSQSRLTYNYFMADRSIIIIGAGMGGLATGNALAPGFKAGRAVRRGAQRECSSACRSSLPSTSPYERGS